MNTLLKPQPTKTRRILEVLGGTVITVVFVLIFIFALLNWAMGCESWDQTYWTETNSCIYPSEFIMMFFGG